MHASLPVSAVAALFVAAVPAAAQPAAEPPEELVAAVTAAMPKEAYLKERSAWLQIETPYTRLAQKIAQAKAKYQPLDAAQAREALVSELRLVAGPEPKGDADVGVRQVLVERADGTVVRATRSERFVDLMQTRRRKGIKLQGLRTAFPFDVLEAGVKIRLEMEDGAGVLFEPDPAWIEAQLALAKTAAAGQ